MKSAGARSRLGRLRQCCQAVLGHELLDMPSDETDCLSLRYEFFANHNLGYEEVNEPGFHF